MTARPDTLRYRIRKFARRHRAAVAATAAMLLLVAGFVASLIVQRRHLAQERDKARYALSFLVDTFKQADPYQARGERLTAREILDQGADRISRELAGEPDVQAAVMDAIGEVDVGLGRYEEAEPLLRRSLALRRQVFGRDSLEVAESLEHLAALAVERSDQEGAVSLLRRALAIRRRQGDEDIAVARTLNSLGQALVDRGVSPEVVPEIEALHQEALTLARLEEGPEGPTVAETLIVVAELRRAQGDYSEAEALFREATAIERRVFGAGDPRLYRNQAHFGEILIEGGKLKEAEALLRKALAEQRKILSREHPDMMTTLNDLAFALDRQGRYVEAEPLYREGLSLARTHYGPMHWRVASALVNLASCLEVLGRRKEAIYLYEESLEIRRRTLGESDPSIGQLLLLLAELYRNNDKDYNKALRLAEQALVIVEKAEGPDHPHVAYALREIGRNYLDQRRFAEAEPFLRRSLDIRQKKLETRHPDVGKAQVSMARCLIGLGRYDEAKDLLREAKVTLAQVYGPSHEMARMPDRFLAEIASLRPNPS